MASDKYSGIQIYKEGGDSKDSYRLLGHSPITWKTIFLDLGRLSKSTKTTCCQVPSVSLLFTKGIVSEAPRMEARTWE